MFKTIFRRLMWSNIFIMLISFIFTGILLFSLLGSYAINQKAETLKTAAPRIAQMTISLQIEGKNAIYDRVFENNLDVFAEITNSLVFITDSKGRVYAKSSGLRNMGAVPKEHLQETLLGKTTQTIGTLGGVFSAPVLTVGYPLVYNNQVIGGIFLNVTAPDMDQNRFAILKLFFMTASVVVLVAFFVIYFMSLRMTKPLKKINEAARNIASGNFKTRVNVLTKDEIGQLAATFNYMADSLQQLDDMQSSFIANVSHELRTPTTTISGFIENILNGTIPKEQQNKYLSIALSEAKRLARLVSDMLDITKMSVGQYSLDIKPFDLAELIRLIVIQFEGPINEKRLDVSVEFQSEQIMALADKDAISRVITNLMDNAVKFSDPEGRLQIKAFTKDKKIYVSIQNEGMGIDPKDIPFIFNRFYKTDKSRSDDKQGTGLGLYLTKNILNMHGQTIKVQSVDISAEEYNNSTDHPARRTTFIFSLEKA